MRLHRLIGLAAVLGGTGGAAGQAIDPNHKFCWQENTGWLNWRDADGGARGAQVHGSFLSGFLWGENIGWVSLGDGTPAGGAGYANATGADAGVNLAPGGDLSGFAWAENAGWINFGGGAMAAPPNPARLAGQRFRGYAWAENLGWVNLDDEVHFVALACYPDCNQDGQLNLADFGCFQTKFALQDPYADCNGDGVLNLADFGCFQTKFALGCP